MSAKSPGARSMRLLPSGPKTTLPCPEQAYTTVSFEPLTGPSADLAYIVTLAHRGDGWQSLYAVRPS